MKTTIQINSETLDKLKMLKHFERQSYEEVLTNLINHYIEDDEPLTEQEIKDINIGLEQIKKGETTSIEDVAKEMGIELR
jgi:predicted CopG family antitoxin